jgi:hypothetical protein
MPDRVLFRDTETSTATEGFYAVMMHEIGHYAAFRIMPRGSWIARPACA